MLEKILGALILASVIAYVVDVKRKLRREIAHAKSVALAAHNLAIALIRRSQQPAPRATSTPRPKGTDDATLN